MAFLDENGLQEFAKLLVEKGEWLGADPDNDNYFYYTDGEYGVRASYARASENAERAEQLIGSRYIQLTGDVTGSVRWVDDGSGSTVSIQTTANITPSSIGASKERHNHTALVNSQGGVVNLLYNTDTSYSLVPKSTVNGTVYRTSLGRGGDEGFYNLWLEGKATIEGGTYIDGTNTFNGITTVYARIQPTGDDGYAINLGHSNNRWANIYSKTALNVSSDLNVKKDIVEIDDRYIEMFDLIQPYAYKFIDGTSGRTHTGFISQYVENAMNEVGLKDTDLAFFCKDALYEEVKDEDGNVIEINPILDEDGNQKYFYSLRYEEYIAIMVEKMKRMEKRINELETKLDKVEELEARLAKLEA